MTQDARFEDASERPLKLLAETSEDVSVVGALLQDAVFPASEVRYDQKRRELAILLNRFRWEDDRTDADAERVRAILLVRDAISVASQGFDRSDKDLVLSLLDVTFEEGQDGTGAIILTLAGDGAIRALVECINLVVQDVTRPYMAPSGKRPHHPD